MNKLHAPLSIEQRKILLAVAKKCLDKQETGFTGGYAVLTNPHNMKLEGK